MDTNPYTIRTRRPRESKVTTRLEVSPSLSTVTTVQWATKMSETTAETMRHAKNRADPGSQQQVSLTRPGLIHT